MNESGPPRPEPARPPLPRRTPGALPRDESTDPAGSVWSDWAARHMADAPVERLRAFCYELLRQHWLVPATGRLIPMYSCRLPARHCAVIRAEHELLDVAVPFRFGPPRPPTFEVGA